VQRADSRARRGALSRAQLAVGAGIVLSYAPQVAARRHAHHALQVSLAHHGPFEVQDRDASWHAAHLALIGSNEPHGFRSAHPVITIYLEPSRREVPGLRARWLGNAGLHLQSEPSDLPQLARLSLALARGVSPQALLDASTELPRALGDRDAQTPSGDPRIQRVVALLDAPGQSTLPAQQLAEVAGMSVGRLIHLFKSEVGIPIRRYVLWRRIHTAVRTLLAEPAIPLAHAAAEAGFADAAHFTRTFVRMFGHAPSEALDGSQIVQAAMTRAR
jgi:AraC-like DNA-binding protein